MDSWFEGIPTVLALAIAAIGTSTAALAVAHGLRVHRRLSGRAAPAASPQAMIERLAALADLSRAEGILSAENRVDPATEPLLAQGLKLIVDGVAPQEITRQLDQALDASMAQGPIWGRVFGPLARIPAVLIAAGAAVPLTFLLTNAPEPEASSRSAAGIACLGFFALTAVGVVAPMTARKPARAAGMLSGVMQVVGAALIRSGCDGNTVRERLIGLLPPSQRASIPLARAA